jgi:hypothetical protein
MSLYEWHATARQYDHHDESEGQRVIRFKGEFETENNFRWNSRELEKTADLNAIQAAPRNGLDPETVEVVDIILIDEGPDKPWWNPFKIAP